MITLVINSERNIDYFFLDLSIEGISIPHSQAMKAIQASLRMKHDVLLLTKESIPTVDLKKRFEVGDDFIYLSPRFLRFMIENYSRQIIDFQDFKAFLTSCK